MIDCHSDSNISCRTELSSLFARPVFLFNDLTFAEPKDRYVIFHQILLRKFASTLNKCSICHVKGKLRACYLDNQGLGHQGLGHTSPTSPKPQAVCEQCRIKQQSKLSEEFKMKYINNNLIIVNNPLK